MRTGKFGAFVRLAENSANTWPRILATLVLIVLVATLGTAGLLGILWTALGESLFTADRLEALLASPYGVAMSLLAMATLWLGLPVGLRFLHRRTLASIIGHDGWKGRRDLIAGLIVGIAVPLIVGLLTIPIGPAPERSGLATGIWLRCFCRSPR